MAKTSIGIEIGNRLIKIVEMKGNELVQCVVEDVPLNMVRNGEIIAFEAMADFLKELFKKYHFASKKVSFVVPDDAVYIRRIRMPAMNASQLAVNLPYEFKDFIPGDKQDFLYDYRMVELVEDESGKVVEMDLLAVAVSIVLMDKYAYMFKLAGLKLVEALPECLAYSNLMQTLNQSNMNQDYAIMDLGYVSTRINLYHKGIFELNREIEQGVSSLVEKASDVLGMDEHVAMHCLMQNTDGILEQEAIVEECNGIAISAMRAVNYYTYQKRENTLETMYVVGGGANLHCMFDAMQAIVPLQLVDLHMLSKDAGIKQALCNAPAALGVLWNL